MQSLSAHIEKFLIALCLITSYQCSSLLQSLLLIYAFTVLLLQFKIYGYVLTASALDLKSKGGRLQSEVGFNRIKALCYQLIEFFSLCYWLDIKQSVEGEQQTLSVIREVFRYGKKGQHENVVSRVVSFDHQLKINIIISCPSYT